MREEAIRRLSTGELVRRLVNNLSSLVDREIQLAKEEGRSNAIRVGAGALLLGLAVLMLYTFLASLIVAAIYAIDLVAPPMTGWSAALIIGGVFLLLALITGGIGLLLARIRPLERTRETVREDVQWIERQIR